MKKENIRIEFGPFDVLRAESCEVKVITRRAFPNQPTVTEAVIARSNGAWNPPLFNSTPIYEFDESCCVKHVDPVYGRISYSNITRPLKLLP